MERVCKWCGRHLYYYMVTPRRTVLRSLDRGDPDPLTCEVVHLGDDDHLTLQHEEAL